MIDPYSPTWQSIKTYATIRMGELRAKLEGDLCPDQTMQVRAQLRELRLLLDRGESDAPVVEPVDIDIPG